MEEEPLGCCIFCGVKLAEKSQNRRRALTSIRHFVQTRCQPTPYAFERLAGMEEAGRALVCIPCVNWQRRCAGRQGKRVHLLLDQLILFLLEPGKTPMPDQRCALRLIKSLRAGGDDWVVHTLRQQTPVPVLAIVDGLREEDLRAGILPDALVRAWWDYNGRTVFFAHHQTAKLVRRAVKGRP